MLCRLVDFHESFIRSFEAGRSEELKSDLSLSCVRLNRHLHVGRDLL